METTYFVVVRIAPEDVVGAAEFELGRGIPKRVRHLPRKERKRIRDAKRAALKARAILGDVREGFKARRWARKQSGHRVHSYIAEKTEIPLPLSVRSIRLKEPKRIVHVYGKDDPEPPPTEIPLDGIVTYDCAMDMLNVWRKQEMRNQLIEAQIIREDLGR